MLLKRLFPWACARPDSRHQTKGVKIKSLPLPVLVIGGAILGYIVLFLALALLKNLAFLIGPIIGGLWGYSLYRKPA